MQLGLDKILHEDHSGKLLAGVSLIYGHGKANVHSKHGRGDINTDAYGVAGSLTWYDNNGFYVDGQLQRNWFRSKLHSSTASKDLTHGKNHGDGYSASAEVGKRIPIKDGLSVTPQAQVIYNHVKFDSFSTQWQGGTSDVSLQKGTNIQGRVGVSLDSQNSWINKNGKTDRTNVYGIVNVYNDFSGKSKVKVSGTKFESEPDKTWAGVGVGGTYSWDNDKYAVYAEGSVSSSMNNVGDSSSYQGTVGFRYQW